ncbi:MAG: HlyD family type I secretion periplasmic adaptor subunit [Rhodobacteraceae bacterium]|nr:HlyD family type I secretion periplasmic adaptor subunit [Paracoccaceae bacterium]
MPDLPDLRARSAIALGATACVILLTGLIGWAASAAIVSAVVAMGEVDVEAYSHPVQHPEGGVVADLLVHEGQNVVAGEILLRLDSSAQRTEYDFVAAQIIETEARMVRLRAERDGIGFPSLPLSAMTDRPRMHALGAQLRLFDARRETFERQRAQLLQRRRQSEAELEGLIAQRAQLDAESEILRVELRNQQQLRDRGLTVSARVSELARDSARLAGSRAALTARDGELHGQITEIALQTAALSAARREEAEEQFADAGLQMIELNARRAALGSRLAAREVRAPATGVVHGLVLAAAGTVLRPAEVVMEILSPPPEPVLTVRVSPDDIDHIDPGQPAMLRFPGLASRDLPDLPGRVTAISAASFVDERTGARHFRVQIVPARETLAMVGRDALIPGMSVQAFIATGVRTPLAYLLDPLRDHFARAMREP